MTEPADSESGSATTRSTEAPAAFLIRSPNPLGDACMSLPAVRAIRKRRPNWEIVVCCRENLAPMWDAQPFVDRVVSFAKAMNPWQVGRVIHEAGPFQGGLLLPNSFRSALELWLGGVRGLVGYNRYQRGIFLRTRVPEFQPPPGKEHHVHRYLNVVAAADYPIEPLNELLAIPPAPTPLDSKLNAVRLGICPGAEYGNAKRYPIERYAEAVESLRKERDDLEISVHIFGSPAERAIGEELAEHLSEPCYNRVGETSIAGLVDELRQCHLLATNDTGTMHLAAALGVPTVAIFGSTEPTFTAPIGEIHRVIRHQVDCSPCFLRECPIDYRCMMRIKPEVVRRELASILQEVGSSRDPSAS